MSDKLPWDHMLVVRICCPPGRPSIPQMLHNGNPCILFDLIIHEGIDARQYSIIFREYRNYLLQVFHFLLVDTTMMEECNNSRYHRPAGVNSEILIK